MKRDLDLSRQLLLDIENRGADCSVSVLRTGPNHEAEERIRYHLRLLIDAGLLKEVDRTASGVPCVRLTHEGHELLELSRSESRWREAKWLCQRRTGGLSLVVIRTLLVRLALAAPRGEVARRAYRPRRRGYVALDSYAPLDHYDEEHFRTRSPYRAPHYRLDPYPTYRYAEPQRWLDDDAGYVHVRPEYREVWRGHDAHMNGEVTPELDGDAVLPDYLI